MDQEKRYPIDSVAPIGILPMNGCEDIGEAIGSILQDLQIRDPHGPCMSEVLVEASWPRLHTGEGKAVIHTPVDGLDLSIICDIGAYQCTYTMHGMEVPMSPDEHYADLKRTIAATNGKAQRINVIMPLLYGGQQYRKNGQESMDCAIMLQELFAMGISNLITFDAPEPYVANAVPLHGFENIIPSVEIIKGVMDKYSDILADNQHMVLISPDESGIRRSRAYGSVTGVFSGFFSRMVQGPAVNLSYSGPSVEKKDVLILADAIGTGNPILEISRRLKEMGAGRVLIIATNASFTGGAARFEEAYERGDIEHVFSADLTYIPPEICEKAWFTKIRMSSFLAQLITDLNHKGPHAYPSYARGW